MRTGRILALTLFLVGLACAEPADERAAQDAGRPRPHGEGRVAIYDPDRAWNGYTLDLHGGRVPSLIDMNGRVVHDWPRARVRSRVRLLEDGTLLALALDRAIVEYDWQGRRVWKAPLPGILPHHDVIRLANGNTMVIAREPGGRTDNLLEVDRAGEIVWRWRSAVHLAAWIERKTSRRRDLTHFNSVQELPANRHYRSGDSRFRPGNLLVSARNLNLVFIVDRQTKEVSWAYDHRLDGQHEALMLAPGVPGHGRIQIFNNGTQNRFGYRMSRVVEIEPGADRVVWRYQADDFFSPTMGVEQPLGNGNVLIGSSRGGRVFEVTREGTIVWEWTPPFNPVRPRRYGYDHCPQLASRPRPGEEAVRPPAGYRYVDKRVYQFARASAIRRVTIDGQRRHLLADNNRCTSLLLPAEARVSATYGLDGRKVPRRERRRRSVTFGLLLAEKGSEESVELLRDEIPLKKIRIERDATIDLGTFAHRWVKLCVETRGLGGSDPRTAERFAYWHSPAIRAGADLEELPAGGRFDDLTPEELELRREHIKTLGYAQ